MYTAECADQGSQDHSQSQMDRKILQLLKTKRILKADGTRSGVGCI